MQDTEVNITLENDEVLEDAEETSYRRQKRDDGRKSKGRGVRQDMDKDFKERYSGESGKFDSMEIESGPLKSIEGWIIIATGIHEEATEDELLDKFSEFGEVKTSTLPLDRRTGFVKGYALLEYAKKEEAQEAIKKLDGTQFMDNNIHVNWAFYKESGSSSNRKTTGRGTKKFMR